MMCKRGLKGALPTQREFSLDPVTEEIHDHIEAKVVKIFLENRVSHLTQKGLALGKKLRIALIGCNEVQI